MIQVSPFSMNLKEATKPRRVFVIALIPQPYLII
jgi:hypothetical protein